MSKLADKLANLLRLATLKPGEEQDEARVNEARTASFLLVKTCQENGVKLSFKLPRQEQPEPPQGVYEVNTTGRATRDGHPVPFDDFIRFVYGEQTRKRAEQETFKRPRAHRSAPPTSPHRANEVYQTTFANAGAWGKPTGCAACGVILDEAEHVWMRRVGNGLATHIRCGTEALFAEPQPRRAYRASEVGVYVNGEKVGRASRDFNYSERPVDDYEYGQRVMREQRARAKRGE